MSPGTRRILTRLAQRVCPPGGSDGLVTAVVDDVLRHIAELPPVARRGIGPALRIFDQAARASNRGRRFVSLPDATANAYLDRVLGQRSGPVALMVRLVKGLIALYHYEQPEVAARLRYDPAAYVAEVSARRLARYGAEIAAAAPPPNPAGAR